MKSMIFLAYTLDPVCWLSFFFLVGKSLSLKLVFYKQAHNSQGLKDFKIQLSFKIFTSEELIRCCMLSIVHVWIWSNIIEKKNLIGIFPESTFVGLRGIVRLATLGKCTVAFGWFVTLDNSSGNIVFCAISLKNQMTKMK